MELEAHLLIGKLSTVEPIFIPTIQLYTVCKRHTYNWVATTFIKRLMTKVWEIQPWSPAGTWRLNKSSCQPAEVWILLSIICPNAFSHLTLPITLECREDRWFPQGQTASGLHSGGLKPRASDVKSRAYVLALNSRSAVISTILLNIPPDLVSCLRFNGFRISMLSKYFQVKLGQFLTDL